MKMSVYTTRQGQVHLSLDGVFNADTCKSLKSSFKRVTERFSSDVIVFDMENVEQIDASGVGAIVFMFKRLREHGGNLLLCGAHGQPYSLLRQLRIHRAISMYQTLPAHLVETKVFGTAA